MAKSPGPERAIIGWREWLALPELAIPAIKAKVDTGARSSALHAVHIEAFEQAGQAWVRFAVHPFQYETRTLITCEAPLVGWRQVRNSGGHASLRPVVRTLCHCLQETWSIELTLANRATMGFRMLLGRQAVRQRFVVDPGRSFLGERPQRRRKRRKRKME